MRESETAARSPGPLAQLSARTRRAGEWLSAGVSALVARPRLTLAALVGVQWLGVVAFALTVRHNGWAYYQGGDQIWLTTTGWLLSEGELAPTHVGYGWPLVLAPITALTGPGYLAAMPAVVAVNLLILAPLALWAIHGLAERIAGRAFALFAAAVWVAAPYAVIPLWRSDYHERYVEQFLPQALGLTALSDYPSMVLLLVGTYLFVRALERRAEVDAVAAGLIVGFAIGMKPSNALYLAGPAAAALLTRRWRPVLAFGIALLPALLALAIWKQRGLGSLPLFAFEETRLAAAAASIELPSVDRYLDVDWAVLKDNGAHLREYFWSARLLEWIPIAGAVGLARRSASLAALVASWFGMFLLIKGSAPSALVSSGSFFRFMMPAYPAYFLLAVGVVLLVPTAHRRLADAWPPRPRSPLRLRSLAVLAAGLAAIPLLAVSFARPTGIPPRALVLDSILTPVDPGIRTSVIADGKARTIAWSDPAAGRGAVFYRVFRTAAEGKDVTCIDDGGAVACRLEMFLLGATRERRWRDGSPPAGALYRIGVGTNSRDDPSAGDVFLLSEPFESG